MHLGIGYSDDVGSRSWPAGRALSLPQSTEALVYIGSIGLVLGLGIGQLSKVTYLKLAAARIIDQTLRDFAPTLLITMYSIGQAICLVSM